ncbi:MAG: hypothetical protein Q7S96_04575 [bacterium]|nr:hypothetical protein [bacterium]
MPNMIPQNTDKPTAGKAESSERRSWSYASKSSLMATIAFAFVTVPVVSLVLGMIAVGMLKQSKKNSESDRMVKFARFVAPASLIFAIMLFIIQIVGIAFVAVESARQKARQAVQVGMESSVPVVIAGFELYTDESKGLQVLFPGQPEVTTFELSGYPGTHYKSLSVVDSETYIQYSVTYIDTEIYSTESINAYLSRFPNGKSLGLGDDAKLVISEAAQYKGFPAREYLIEYTSEGVKIKNEGVGFIVNGDPIDLSVSYPATMDGNDTHFNEFTSSFVLR